jgi:hypothetical protein
MPTTLTGLLLFVVLLLPGFAYTILKERNTPTTRRSSFRETVEIAAVSVVAGLVALLGLAGARAAWPGDTPDIASLLRDPGAYLETDHVLLAWWGIGLLALATVVSGAAGWKAGRRAPHVSVMSSWWRLFDEWPGDREIHVTCMLDDGSSLRGTAYSFNNASDETGDRDLILVGPIHYALPGEEEAPYGASAACVSVSRIVTLFVTYLEPEPTDPTSPHSEPSAWELRAPEVSTAAVPARTRDGLLAADAQRPADELDAVPSGQSPEPEREQDAARTWRQGYPVHPLLSEPVGSVSPAASAHRCDRPRQPPS